MKGVVERFHGQQKPRGGLPDGEQIGLVAQEVQKVVPTAVQETGDGYLAVDYSRLVPLLIEAVKEQQKQIESMRQELAKALGNRPW